MSLILNIDTAVQASSVCLAENNNSLGLKISPSQKDSAAWLHVAIEELLKEANLDVADLDAIAVTEGPGSYTGLRVGMATAKGLCYALNKPLITLNTLLVMAVAAQNEATDLLCPMIDARRMEVFTALLNKELEFVLPPSNLILAATSFQDVLHRHTITFFGNGSMKFQQLLTNANAVFKAIDTSVLFMISLSHQKLIRQDFADLAYSQPFYGKDFHSPNK